MGIGRGDRVAVRGPSAVGWLIAEFAVQAIGGVVVGLDSHLSPRATKERLESVKAKLLINIGTQVESIESLDVVGELNLPQNGMAVSTDAEPVNFGELPDVLPSEMATIVFTSGTTGSPKQIAFTHFQLALAIEELRRKELPILGSGDATICWLPMSHLFQRMANLRGTPTGGYPLFRARSAEHPERPLREANPKTA